MGAFFLWDKLETGLKKAEAVSTLPARFLQKMGLSLQNVYVEGRSKTAAQELLTALNLQRGDYIFKANLAECYDQIQKLKWVRSVMIERRLPSTLYIRLVEKKPIAIWQHQNKFYLVDTLGTVICEAPRQQYPHFMIVTGDNAPKALPQLLEILHQYPDLKDCTNGAIFVGQRRWDLLFKRGLRIKLPEADMERSCKWLIKLIKEKRLNNPEIQEVDLRNADRTYFYLKGAPKQELQNEAKSA